MYKVSRLHQAIQLQADWEAPAWKDIAPLELTHFMGECPDHFPRTQARVAYDDEAIYVMFRVHDRYVRAMAERRQGEVFKDSCVEFFFTPGSQIEEGYFNLEMNCGGTMLFHYQRVPWKDQQPLADDLLDQVQVVHSLPKIVNPELAGPTTWVVAYRVPFSVLAQKFPVPIARPGPGVRWRANFYKCADATSHPHWLTWAPMSAPQPDFHRPQDFGELVFE